jgi:hypothetical protein
MKIYILMTAIILSSTAQASVFFDGTWTSAMGTNTLYHDQTVVYENCQVSFRVTSAEKAMKAYAIKIEKLSAHCEHPKYWSFNEALSVAEFLVSAEGDVTSKSGLKVGTLNDHALSVVFDRDTQKLFIDIKLTPQGVQFDWSARSFQDLNFDLSALMLQSSR